MIREPESEENSISLSTDKALAIWEIASVITSGLVAEWVVLSFVGKNKLVMAVPIVLAVGLMLLSHRDRAETLRDLGFRADNFIPACRKVLLPTVIAVLLMILTAWLMKQSTFTGNLRPRFLLLPLWALFQQYTLQGFINRRAQLALGQGLGSVALVGVVFSLIHLPNPLLAILTFLAGIFWASVYQQVPNLFAIALSHSVASFVLAFTISPNLLYSLRVGFKYLR
jgi:xanthosine utilization system XapX-like protein